MLFRSPSASALLILYLLTVAVSTVRLGWRSGLTAAVFAVLVMFGFPAVHIGNDLAFILLSALVIGMGDASLRASGATSLHQFAEARAAAAAARVKRREEERVLAEHAAAERLETERKERERLEREREELARALEAERKKVGDERAAADRKAAEQLDAERKQRERLEQEREELARKLQAESATRRADESAQEQLAAIAREKQRLEAERQKLQEERDKARRDAEQMIEQRLAAERAELQRKYDEQLRAEREVLAKAQLDDSATRRAPELAKPQSKPPAVVPERGMFDTLTAWLKTPQRSKSTLNLKPKKPIVAPSASKRPASTAPATARPKPQPQERRPRILMLERRRGTADAVAPRLRDLGIEVQIVERWIDAIDEIFRFRPDAIFLDAELSEFQKVYKSVADQAPRLPIFITAGSHGALPNVPRAASVIRPYSADGVAKLARESVSNPQIFLDRQRVVAPPPQPAAFQPKPQLPAQPRTAAPAAPQESDRYDVVCFNCRVAFDATDADWCSCLTKERTLVCTNCLTCFCKAPPAYKEKFWVEAPPKLFERKSAELRKQQGGPMHNVTAAEAKRPLVMLVEDDEDIQTIVRRVCTNLGYGFITATNGQDGLDLAREYKPNLILSDAFMPRLDGREMCRILKEESIIPECKMIVMTGLYTDTKYKTEALKRFHIDDYLSKPVSITDLINLLQKHLEGASGTPAQEDLHELHRKDVDAARPEEFFDEDRGIPLAELLEAAEERPQLPITADRARAQAKTYEICCFTCGKMFDATQAEWCTCLGRDQTLMCPHCNTCFCKAPAAYKERFWIDAPSVLFERKMIGSKRSVSGKANPSAMEVKRPLILLVEDDENIQLIVKTVVTSMGYGFIVGANGQEGLAMAREYNPDLILSDAFMPKLDGREMCRLLKEDPATARAKAIIMTGLYTDRKYRNEALSYFKVDDYVAKPVAVDDLIKLMKKHLPQEVQPTM